MAADAAVRLGDEIEVFRLPLTDSAGTARAIFDRLRAQGFALTFATSDSVVAVAARGGARHLVHHARDRRTHWLYVGAVVPDEGPARPSVAAAAPPPPPALTAAPSPRASPGGPIRYQFTSTTFADGWVATEQTDHIRAVQGPLTVWLMHRRTITEEMRPPVISLTDYLWTKDVATRFNVVSFSDREDLTQYSGMTYREGTVRMADGRTGFVAMFASVESGTAVNVIAHAADAATVRQRFPRPETMESALRLNRFGIAAADVPGTWSSNDGAYMPMYYVASGAFAGMAGGSLADEFVFLPDGTYRSRHSGASAGLGRARSFSQQYAGTWRLDGLWTLVLTGRADGTTETFDAMFSSVSGGRILHLIRQPQSGIRYNLGRRPPE